MPRPRTIAGDSTMAATLLISVVVHAVILLGVGFAWSFPDPRTPSPMIEIALATDPQEKAPEDYDFLASANQDGGGSSEEAIRPEKPQKALTPGVSEGRHSVNAAPAPHPEPEPERQRSVTGGGQPEQTPDAPSKEQRDAPSAAELIDTSRRVASASEFSTPSERIDARFPDKRRINARTRSHAAAAYMRSWIDKVERVGNLNYPREARRERLSGRLILEVTLTPEGDVRAVEVLRASAHPVLNQAAQRIVDLAGPFAPVPPEVLEGKDLLVITRTWEFAPGTRFRAD
ncbi:energy transducer TonB family protein [Arhodomonas sp. AD133]|uniref:energy transducer TonB family protein n=1 Tax=Arhodomonas sp. AD133 TaxID=3415009 RepID=UPI003EB7A595